MLCLFCYDELDSNNRARVADIFFADKCVQLCISETSSSCVFIKLILDVCLRSEMHMYLI